MAESRERMSPGARRTLRAAAWAAALTVLLLVALNVGSVAWVRSVTRDAAAAGLVLERTPGAASPARARPAAERLAATTREAMPREAAEHAPDATREDWREALKRFVTAAAERRGPVRRHVHDLGQAVHDEDAPVSTELRAWLDAHAADLGVVESAFLREPDPEVLREALRSTIPPEKEASPEMTFTRARYRLIDSLGARASSASTDGRREDAERACDAVLRVTALKPRTAVPHGLLRRVRPDNPDWIAWIDENLGRDRIDETLGSFIVWEPPTGPYHFGWETLDVLLDDLPRPVNAAFQHVVLGPATRVQWAARTGGALRRRAELLGSGDCLPQREILPPDSEWAWRFAVQGQGLLMVTREVLRLSHPSSGVAPFESPCPDWNVTSETLSDGSLRVFVTGSVAELPPPNPDWPTFERVIPAP